MKQQLKKLYALFSRRDKIKFGILVFFMIITGFLELVGIGVIPAFLGSIVFPEEALAYPVVGDILRSLKLTTAERLLLAGSAVLLVAFVAKNVFIAFNFALQARYTSNRMADIRTRLFAAYMNAPYPFFLQRNSAELLRNANMECNKLGRAILMPLLQFIMRAVLLVMILTMLLIVNPLASLIMVGILALTGIAFVVKLQHKVQEYGKIERDERGFSNKYVQQGLESIKEARILGREDSFIDAFRQSARKAAKSLRFQQTIQRMGAPLLETVGVFTMVLIAILLVWGLDSTVREAIPTLALFAVALGRLRGVMQGLVQGITQLRYNLVSVDPVYDDLKLLKKLNEKKRLPPPSQVKPLKFRQHLQVEELTFYYENTNHPAVADVNLTIPQGDSVAFVGPTGAGKTTIVDLLLGLLEPTSGQITVDGVDIHSNLRGWQKNIGYIPQSIYLLDDNLKRNIALGIPDDEVDYERLRSVVTAAQLDDMVGRLSHGLETFVGERGVRLSGGQRQRIGIARALYHNPDVLVMDEATSNLDSGTEKAIVESVNELKGNRTIIMIAHRLTTVKDCDTLYFLREGRLEAQGTYEELYRDHQEFRIMAN
ncbi:MAG: ABC transporter ATP-binding protein [Verrucomicrobiota bacterium]